MKVNINTIIAAMLVAFLLGIGGGSALYSWLWGARRASPLTFAALQIGIGLAGAVMSPVVAINPNMGLDYFARTFLVVIIGGIGSMLGVLGGGSLIGMLEAGLSAFLKPIVAQVIVLVMAILVIRLRPQGIFGKAK